MKKLSFVIVGSGWRSLFYVRIAKRFPELFELKYMLCRTQEKADAIAREYDISTTTSEYACEQTQPDFVVVAVTKGTLFAEVKKWSDKGYPVLSETPVAVSVAELKEIWNMIRQGARIQIAEQYHRYPLIAAGLRAISEGRIAEPQVVTLSVAHDYHAISLIRRMLQPDNPMGLQLQFLRGERYVFPITETNSRTGVITDGRVKDSERIVITLQFENGKLAFYDFDKVQYHSSIRARHLNVQGQDGEWNDTMLRYVNDQYIPIVEKVTSYLNPKYRCVETEELREFSLEWKSFISMDDVQDEYAMATMMLDMGEYIAHGKEIYPLAEALEDEYIWLLMQEVIKKPGERIFPEIMPWNKEKMIEYDKRIRN